jgi:hypothetical protein
MSLDDHGDGWVSGRTSTGAAAVVITDRSFGFPVALAIRTEDLLATRRELERDGWTLTMSTAGHAVFEHPSGLVALAYPST